MDDSPLKIKASDIDEATFLETYGGIYEHSLWVAKNVWSAKTGTELDTLRGLSAAMKSAVEAAPEPVKTALLCAHPDLAGKLAVGETLTADSRSEQAGAGLDNCSAEEYEEFQKLNSAYKEKFAFPFIIAVKGHNRQSILSHFRARLLGDRETEFNSAMNEVHKIAGVRLKQLTE